MSTVSSLINLALTVGTILGPSEKPPVDSSSIALTSSLSKASSETISGSDSSLSSSFFSSSG